MDKKPSGNEVRQSFIDFFEEHRHTYVPSTSLVPAGDATLLFTNAGMVQFKDVFLGTDDRPYKRAVNSQKCMRVAGKHNDLEDVGRDDSHHTFFEMLGNWSFGDYYKTEALGWAWTLLTEVWGLAPEKLYATCFKDDKGSIPADKEAADIWLKQPGFDPTHVLYFGRKDNFWEMAETGPCGPCSEIHIDRGEEFDNLAGTPHRCGVNGECQRYLELWNNVFIQYNRTGPETLQPLPLKHVDTGMGFERIVAVIQGVDSNYKIDLFSGILGVLRQLTGDSEEEMYTRFTPYRVIADHARAAVFLIADGVVPGNIGRNYICRMIIRRAARFGTKLGLNNPFMARAAEAIISAYGDFYPELMANKNTILDLLTREEERFSRTIESGTSLLLRLLDESETKENKPLDGRKAFDLYATYGLPFEIARDIAREKGKEIEEAGFRNAMDEHRLVSGGGKAMGKMDGENADFYKAINAKLHKAGKISPSGVTYNPYSLHSSHGELLSLIVDSKEIQQASAGDEVEVILPETKFYLESGGQVSDNGYIRSVKFTEDQKPEWEIEIYGMKRTAPGVIVHVGEVIYGQPKVGDNAQSFVELERRMDTMRNHTATHLLHTALQQILGTGARQAGSLVAPDHLRFDYNQPQALSDEQVSRIEKLVNTAILQNMEVTSEEKDRKEAVAEGATALFGEKYGERVRTISITNETEQSTKDKYSYELCGGTHIQNTSEIGLFLIVSESSVAAGIRRIEAVTGRRAYDFVSRRSMILQKAARQLKVAEDDLVSRVEGLQKEISFLNKQNESMSTGLASARFIDELSNVQVIDHINILFTQLPGLDRDTLAKLADKFRQKYPEKGICVVVSPAGKDSVIMCTVTKDLIQQGIKAGELVGTVSRTLGGGGGGAPHLAFGGGRDISKIKDALLSVQEFIKTRRG